MSRNSPDTDIRVLNTIRHDKLDITRSAFTAGETVADYLDAFDVDLFLTTNVEDAQKVIDSRFCTAAILRDPPSDAADIPMEEGPYVTLLKKIAKLQERLPTCVEYSPVRIALVTARNSSSEMRVIKTLRS